MAYIAIIGLIITLLGGFALYKTYINPLSVFIGTFCLGFFLLFSTDFFDTSLISGTTWIMYFVSFLCFIIGIIIQRFLPLRIKHKSNTIYSEEIEKNKYKNEIIVIFVFSLIATLVYWGHSIVTHGFSGFFMQLLTTKETESASGLPTTILYIKMLTIFLSPYVVFYIMKYKEKIPYYIGIVIFTFFANVAYTRNVLFYILILDLFVVVFFGAKRKKKISFKWIIYLVIGTGAFRFFGYTQSLFKKQFGLQGTFFGNKLSNSLLTIISYFAGPLISSGIYMQRIDDVPFLGFTFRSVLNLAKSFGLLALDTNAYMPTEFVYIPFKFNTCTIQLYIMKEGGWIWFIIFFIIIGYIADRAFWNYRRSKSRYAMMGLIFIALLLITSIRSYMLTRLDMFIYIITLLLLMVARRIKVKR